MDKEAARRIALDLDQLRIVSRGAWHIVINWRGEVGTRGTLRVLEEAIELCEHHIAQLKRELGALKPAPRPTEPKPRKYTGVEHPRAVRLDCRATTKAGKPCSALARHPSPYCGRHQHLATESTITDVSDLVAKLGATLPGRETTD